LPVCSPRYLSEHGPLHRPSKSRGHALLHYEPTPFSWADFFALTGVDNGTRFNEIHFTDHGLSVQGAMLDQGVVLGWITAIAAPLNSGQLVPAWTGYISRGFNYILESRSAHPSRRTREVSDWFFTEMRQDLKNVNDVLSGLTLVEKP
jgi:LysR family transcriptional regulator, glycine cleavage system transcriptional activator